MAAAALSGTSLPATLAGLNITDASFTTLVAGAGNGVTYTYDSSDLLILKNDTGGAGVFSFTPRTPTSLSEYGITAPDATLNIANNKSYAVRLSDIFASTAGAVVVTCNVAGKALLVDR